MTQALEAKLTADTSGYQASITQAANLTDAQMKRIAQLVKAATAEQDRMAASLKAASGASSASYKAIEDGAEKVRSAHAGVNRELLVLGHELSQGNFSRFGGSMLVLAERTDALSFAMTAAGAATLGLGVVATGFIAEMVSGAIEADRFNKALIATNNFAGMTADSLRVMASAAAMATGGTVGKARTALEALVASGKFGPDTIFQASQAVVQMERVTGQSAEEIVKDFSRMSDGVAKWATEHNASFHYLSSSQYEYIKRVEEQQGVEAAETENLKLLNAQFGKVDENLGLLARGWQSVTKTASEYLSIIKNFGAQQSLGDQVSVLDEKLARLKARRDNFLLPDTYSDGPATDDAIAEVEERRRTAQRAQANQTASATMKALSDATHDAGVRAREHLDAMLKSTKGAEAYAEAMKRLQKQLDDAANDGSPYSAKQQAALEAKIKAETMDHTGDKGMSAYGSLVASIDAYNSKVSQEIEQQGKLSESQAFAIEQHKRLEEASRSLTAAQRADVESRTAIAVANGHLADQAKEYRSVTAAIQMYNEQTRIALGQQKALTEPQKWAAGEHQKVADSPSLSAIDRAGANMAIDASASQRDYADRVDAVKKYAQGIEDAEAQARALIGATADQVEALRKLQGFDNVMGRALDGASGDTLERLRQYGATMRGTVLASINETKSAADAFNNSFAAGLSKSMDEFTKRASDDAASAKKFFDDAANGMTDAITNFAMTGKLSVKSMVDSIIKDLIRMEAQKATMAIFNAFGGGFGGGGGGGDASGIVSLGMGVASAAGYANGLDYVPYDGFPAILHQGEKVLTKQEAISNRQGNQGGDVHIHIGGMSFGAGVDASAVSQAVRTGMSQTKAEIYRQLNTGTRR